MEKMTIKKISELAGVSPSAVSFVLNNKKGVSDETRERIQTIIEKVNYTPNVNSRRLVLERSFNIFLVLDNDISSLNNLFYTALINAIVEKASELGYNLVLTLKAYSFKESSLLHSVKQGNADGIVFLQDIDNATLHYLEDLGIPYIVIDSHKSDPEYVCVKSDMNVASYTATEYLISQGHKEIAFVGMGKLPELYLSAFNGYKKSISEHSLNFHPDWIQSEAYDEATAYNCMKSILKSDRIPTAIFCSGDIFAIGCMNCAHDMGYRVPDDISFCAVDNILLSEYYSPPLTTINIDKVEMGKKSVELLDALINKKTVEKIHVVKSNEIIVRRSVRNLLNKV